MSQVLPPHISSSVPSSNTNPDVSSSSTSIHRSPSPHITNTTPPDQHHPKKLGVTHSIREKLSFQDERLWKRFSARRLELIDTLDLCSKKASEQEEEIKRVAQALRLEFNYSTDYEQEFDKLVRAAVQSVRRNRKRSSKSKKNHHHNGEKRVKIEGQTNQSEADEEEEDDNETVSDTTYRNRFVSEISRLDSDSQGQTDLNYSRTKNFSSDDKAKATIDNMIKPRILQNHPHNHQPPLHPSHPPQLHNHLHQPYQPSNVSSSSSSSSPASFQKIPGGNGNGNTTVLPPILPINDDYLAPPPKLDANAAKGIIINHIERSKTCSESVSKKSENLQVLGKLIIQTCISYVFEKSFENVNETSIQYLRNKLSGDIYLARFFRDLDPSTITSISDEVATISLYTLLGGVVKDFGFEQIIFPLCEIIYVSILEEYPLIAKNSIPFKYSDYLNKSESNSLNSLATLATEMQEQQQQQQQQAIISAANSSRSLSPELHPYNRNASTTTSTITSPNIENKQVILRFINQSLEFTYSTKNSAPPRFIEIIENARQAFNLKHDVILGIKNSKNGIMMQNDFDLERLFKTSSEYRIELEIFTQRSKAIPIYEITSAIIPNSRHTPPNINDPPPSVPPPPTLHHVSTEKYILPPPLVINHHLPPALRGSPIMNSTSSGNGTNNGGIVGKPPFNFLSNSSEELIQQTKTPPPAMLPRFQPLL